jgi:hypothetical protein
MTTKTRAAAALDATHYCGECGPVTMKARKTIAAYLDGAVKIRASLVAKYCGYLEMVSVREIGLWPR